MEQANDIVNQYKDKYLSDKKIVSDNNDFLLKIKDAALEELLQYNFPQKKNEKYKYTFLTPIFENIAKQKFVESAIKSAVSKPILKDANTIYLQNGLIVNLELNDKITVSSLKDSMLKNTEIIETHLSKYSAKEDGFVALNTMLFADGLFVHLPKSTMLERPIQIVNNALKEFSQTRNLIIIDENSEAEIYLFDFSSGINASLSNNVTEIFVGENAKVKITKVQIFSSTHQDIGHTFIHQKKQSVVDTTIISLDGALIRNNINVILAGEGAEHNNQNLFISDKARNVDNYTFVHHAVPHCNSNQLVKGILKDKATAAFNGKILVSKDAQKTTAYQKNNNLLLSADAKMNTRPQLEIYADDVKCSHGATVGQLNSDALFYMQARGIGEKEAKLLLIQGFANEIIESISNTECRDIVLDWVMEKLQ